jgi:hypothetical protein
MSPNVSNNTSTRNPFDDDDDDVENDAPETADNNIENGNDMIAANTTSRNPKAVHYEEESVSPEQRRILRIREESVRRLSNDISQVRTTDGLVLNADDLDFTSEISRNLLDQPSIAPLGNDEIHVSSCITAAIEMGIDRDLFVELQQKMKHSSATISKICSEHSDAFLASIGRVGSLGSASEEIRSLIQQVCSISFQILFLLLRASFTLVMNHPG